MTTKFDRFLCELVALCEKHRVVLSPEAYDRLQVWDKDPDRDEPVLHFPAVMDLTTKLSWHEEL